MTRSSQSARHDVVTAYFTDLEIALAPDRLASYRPAGAGDLAAIATYFWNMALSRDLHMGLGAAEVSMRNGIHNALTVHAGRADWYDVIPLLPNENSAVQNAKDTIRASKKSLVPGRIVAGLPFGFWTAILSTGFGPQGYGAALWSPNSAALVKQAFPHLQPPNENRSYVHNRFNILRLLRNRTHHHEPIWQGMVLRSGMRFTLQALYDDILEAIGWTSPRLRDSIVAFDRFPDTLAKGMATQINEMETFLGI